MYHAYKYQPCFHGTSLHLTETFKLTDDVSLCSYLVQHTYLFAFYKTIVTQFLPYMNNSFALWAYLAQRYGQWCEWKLTKKGLLLKSRKQNGAAFATWSNMVSMRGSSKEMADSHSSRNIVDTLYFCNKAFSEKTVHI